MDNVTGGSAAFQLSRKCISDVFITLEIVSVIPLSEKMLCGFAELSLVFCTVSIDHLGIVNLVFISMSG